MDIHLIFDKSELEGTAYFEFLPGAYKGKCWNESSVFLEEETFGLIEPIFEQNLPKFDHHAFTEVNRTTWTEIISGLRSLAESLAGAKSVDDIRPALGFLFRSTEKSFNTQFPQNVQKLKVMIDDLIAWLESKLADNYVISVLGM